MFKHQLTVLPSGLTVIQVPMSSVSSVTVLALANTGSRYEVPAKQGIAHFFEHIVFKGTKSYPSTQALAEKVDSVGANFNAFTSKEYTGYYVKSASQHLDLALDVVSDMLMSPLLRQADIDKEKGVIIEELNMYSDMPASHIADLFENMVYTGGLQHDVIGTKATIQSITSQDFTDFLNQWYGFGNLILIVAGDETVVSQPGLLQKTADMFAKGEDQARKSGKQKLDRWVKTEKMSDRKLHVEYKKTEQAHFVMSWPGIKRGHQDRYALSLLDTVLGSSFSSRLFSEVREKRGLCYYINSDAEMLHGIGSFGASAGVDPGRVEEAVKVTIAQFTDIASGSHLVTSKELQRAKDYTLGKTVLGLEDSQSVAQYFGMKQLLRNEIETPQEFMEQIKAVTLSEVNRVASDLIKPGELRFAIIGPYKDEGKFEKYVGNV